MGFGSPNLVNRNEINLINFLAIYSKVIALFSIMPQPPICSSGIGIRCIKHKCCTPFVSPGSFTLNAPEPPLSILNDRVVPLVTSIWSKDYVTKLKKSSDNGCLANLAYHFRAIRGTIEP